MEPPNNESIGTTNFWRFSLLRGKNLLKCMQMVHWKNFIMRGFSLLGEFIIGGSTVPQTYFVSVCMMAGCVFYLRVRRSDVGGQVQTAVSQERHRTTGRQEQRQETAQVTSLLLCNAAPPVSIVHLFLKTVCDGCTYYYIIPI